MMQPAFQELYKKSCIKQCTEGKRDKGKDTPKTRVSSASSYSPQGLQSQEDGCHQNWHPAASNSILKWLSGLQNSSALNLVQQQQLVLSFSSVQCHMDDNGRHSYFLCQLQWECALNIGDYIFCQWVYNSTSGKMKLYKVWKYTKISFSM